MRDCVIGRLDADQGSRSQQHQKHFALMFGIDTHPERIVGRFLIGFIAASTGTPPGSPRRHRMFLGNRGSAPVRSEVVGICLLDGVSHPIGKLPLLAGKREMGGHARGEWTST